MKQRVVFRSPKVNLGTEEEKVASIKEELEKSTDELFVEVVEYEQLVQRFVNSDETITIEFDTEAKTATVVEI